VKNYWLDKKKRKEQETKEGTTYIYPKNIWKVVQTLINKRKAKGP
jgi:hypothetical protein